MNQQHLAGFLQDKLIRQVQRESQIEHANDPKPELPVYSKPPKIEITKGLVNFARLTLNSLKP